MQSCDPDRVHLESSPPFVNRVHIHLEVEQPLFNEGTGVDKHSAAARGIGPDQVDNAGSRIAAEKRVRRHG